MISVITLDREYGSGASEIARKLGTRLGWNVWDERLTTEIARLMDCDCRTVEMLEERRDALYYRMLKAFFRGSTEAVQNAPHLRMVDADCIRQVAERVVLAAAKDGHSVLVGRGSAYYLRNRRDAFHVFIHAPFEDKVRRLTSTGLSEREAADRVDTVDRDRAAFLKQFFKARWPDWDLFHLLINSSIGDEAVVDRILHGIEVVEELSQRAAGPPQ
jgi:cytidylate kinase